MWKYVAHSMYLICVIFSPFSIPFLGLFLIYYGNDSFLQIGVIISEASFYKRS